MILTAEAMGTQIHTCHFAVDDRERELIHAVDPGPAQVALRADPRVGR